MALNPGGLDDLDPNNSTAQDIGAPLRNFAPASAGLDAADIGAPLRQAVEPKPVTPAPRKPGKFAPVDTTAISEIARAEGAEQLVPVIAAIYGQESGGNPNSRTSIDGAQGGMQIIPATFQRYARPGERIDNPDDNMRVGIRYIADLGRKFGNDPARIAAGYFSGEGNVNAGGSTPFKNDRADGNGKRVSGYVQDVLDRIGAGGEPPARAQGVDTSKAPTWAQVTANPEFSKLSDSDQRLAQDAYFQKWIAPNVPAAEVAQYKEWFDSKAGTAPGKAEPASAPADDGSGILGTARNLLASTLKIGPTALKGVAEVGSLLTGDSVDLGVAAAMKRGMEAIDDAVATGKFNKQQKEFAAVMSDDKKGIGDMFSFLLDNPAVLVDQSITTIGSMFLPAAAAKGVATGAVALGKGSIAGKAAVAATIGTTAAQNAADTFASLEKESLEERYKGATVSAAVSLLAGIATGGGAEGAIAKKLAGELQAGKIGLDAVKNFFKAIGKEAAQEAGEEVGNVAGTAVGSGEAPSAISAAKQVTFAGTLGGLMGGGVNLASGAIGNKPGAEPVATPDGRVEYPTNLTGTSANAESVATENVAPSETQTNPVVDRASVAPVATDSVAQDDTEVLDFAESRRAVLESKRDGATVENVDEATGEVSLGAASGQALTPAERAELQAIEQASGDPAALRNLYGFNQENQSEENVATQDGPDGSAQRTDGQGGVDGASQPVQGQDSGPSGESAGSTGQDDGLLAASGADGQGNDVGPKNAVDASNGQEPAADGQVQAPGDGVTDQQPAPKSVTVPLAERSEDELRQQLRNANDRGVQRQISEELQRRKAEVEAKAPAPGGDVGNGFKQGPQNGERYRVGVVDSVGGAVALEKRLPAGTAATFYVGKDGNLVDGDSVNLIGATGTANLWIPENQQQADQAISLLDEMGKLALNDPKRADAKKRLKDLVTAEKAPAPAPEPVPPAPPKNEREAKQRKAIDRIAKGTAYFGKESKARDWVKENGLTENYTVQRDASGANKWNIVPKQEQANGTQADQAQQAEAQRPQEAAEPVTAPAKEAGVGAANGPVASAFTGKPDPRNSGALPELEGYKTGEVVDVPNRTFGRSKVQTLFNRESVMGVMPMARLVREDGKTLDVLTSELSKVKTDPSQDLDTMFDDVLAEEVAKDQAAKAPPKTEKQANLIKAAKDSGKLEIVSVGDKPKTEKQAKAKRSQANPRAMTYEGRAVDGKPINGGDVFSTSSGRATTPYPTQKSEKYATQWLIDNAVAEAEARGDDFNARSFKAETAGKGGSLPPASVALMQEYLFGEQPAVVSSILKPLGSAATNTAKGLTNAIDGLGALFGGAGKLGSGLSFDEDTYAKAKPLFIEAAKNIKDAGSDIKEVMRAVVRLVLDKFGAEATKNMKPYAVRFISDVQAGSINLQGDDNASTPQPDRVPAGNSPQAEPDVTTGEGNRQPVDAGVAEGGTAATGDGRVPASPDAAGGSGTGRAGGSTDNAPGTARNSAGVGPESGAADGKPGDFDLTGEDIGTGGLTRKYKDNIAAIRVLKALDTEGRVATPDERKQLARYVGWGALKAAFDPANTKWAKQYEELKGLLTDAEYKAARASTLDAHYTSPVAVGAMFNALERLGFKKGRVLEPSVGSGNFFGLMPKDMRAKSSLFGVELDPLTSKLSAALYPSAQVKNTGFEDFDIPAGYFDVVVGNPPFGNTPVRDAERSPYSGFSVHNYFLAKGIDKLRPGGIMQVVVSHNFLDANDGRARKWIAERANLIGAVRLPNTAFKENAGTEVVTDILVFQKKDDNGTGADIAPWLDVVEQVNVNAKTGENVTHKVNQLFAAKPDLVLGKPSAGGSLYAANEYTVEPTGDMAKQLDAWVKTLPENVYQGIDRGPDRNAADVVVPDGIKVGSFYLDASGNVMQRGEDVMGNRTAERWAVPTTTRKGVATESATAVKRMAGMVELRDTLRAQMRLERLPESTEQEIAANRAKLNQQYDAFLKAYGHLNNQTNRRIFLDDPESQLLQALEFDFDKGVSDTVAEKEGIPARGPSATKADIFSRRVVFPPQDSLTVSSAKDALLASLNFKGGVDLAYMQSVYSKDADGIVAELGDIVFNDPQAGVVMAEEYLSGDVKTKLAEAESAAKSNPAMRRNVEALRKIIPADKKPSEITVSIGAAFVPAETYREFVKHITGGDAALTYLAATGQWLIDWKGQTDPSLNTGKYGTAELSARDLFQMTMMGKGAIVKKIIKNNDGSTTTIVLEKETEAARAKQNAIKDEWKAWLWKDAERADAMVSTYNEKMNRIVVRQFDGEHMTFPGMNPGISLLPHQKNGVWRGLQTFQTLYDHVVGAGKTFEMATLAMEMRRLGIARKPVFVVPNHLTLQWRSEFTRLYPTSNVLAATPEDFGKGNREKIFSKIVTGDWDAVIIGHSSLKKIGLPAETEKAILQEQIDEISAAIEEMKRARGDRNIIGDMERIRKTLDAKMKDKLAAIGKRDKVLTFDELGMDAMFIDEMHEFKNLSYNSTMDRVPGMGNPKGSDKSFDLFVKIRWMFDTFGAKTPLITATGTPVSNSLVEMYNMQRFMQYPTMKDMGTHVFDAWARQFGSVESVYEVSPSGTGFRQSNRFAKFTNLPALMAQYNKFADVITLDDLKAQEEGRGKKFPVPKLVGGRPQIVVAERSPQVAEFMGVPRVETNEDGSLKFVADVSQNIDITQDEKSGKWLAKVGTDMLGSFDTKEDARLKVVEKALTPVIGVDPKSILGQFANLKQLTKESKGKINALSLTGQANKAGLDFRLINPAAPDFPGSKINKAIDNAVQIYNQWTADKGAQLIFSDLSVPLSARASLGSKAMRVYVKGDDGLLTHKRGTLHTLEGYESLPYIVTEQGVKETRTFDLYDAATGIKLQSGFKTKAEAREKANAWLIDGAKRDKWIEAREAAGDIEQDQIDDYNDLNEIDTEETASITREDIAGMSGSSKFSVYDDIKAKLIARGIPEREIAFIHDYSTPTAKAKLFKAVNSGDIRFLLGSTPKMGAGTNVQERLVGLHHIDAPWRPSDLEQREGRIIRRGNKLYERDPEGFEVAVYRYATSQTYDTRRWQILEHKARGIEQLRNYDGTLNEIDDIAGEAANSADMKAAASGDPLILEETRLRNEVRRLEQLEVAHADNVVSMNRKAQSLQQSADKYLPAQRAMFVDMKATVAKNPVGEDEFPKLNVDGRVVRDKDAAVAAITGMVKTVVQGANDTEKSMDYRGLKFTLVNRGFAVYLYGPDMQSSIGNWAPGEAISPTGLIQRMGNYVGRFDAHIDDIDAKIVQAKKQAVDLREQAKEPFGQTADLARVRDDYRGVQRALIAKGPDVPADQKKAVTTALEAQREALRQAGFGDALKEFMGAAAAFARADKVGGLTVAGVRQMAEVVTSRWQNGPRVEVVPNMQAAAIPAAVRAVYQRQQDGGALGTPEAFYYGGAVYLVADGLASPRSVMTALFHESLGHYGLRKLYGNQLNGILDRVVKDQRAAVEAKAKAYGLDITKPEQAREAAEEVLAELAQAKPDLDLVQRAVAVIRAWLRKIPALANLRMTNAEIIRDFIIPARLFVERGRSEAAGLDGVPAMSRVAPITDAFKKWFGDSKVVDAEGKPLVVYHGTPNDFAEFDLARANPGDPDFTVNGFHFHEDPYLPGVFAGKTGNVMPVYLSIKNPASYSQVERTADRINDTWEQDYPQAATLLVAVRLDLERQGFDGFKPYKNGGQWVAFRPEQIKSATGNNGEFDAANPDIRFSRNVRDITEEAQKEVIGKADTYGWMAKTLQTQYHKAQKDEDFAKVFNLALAMQNEISLTSIRPAELAPGILHKVTDAGAALKTLAFGNRASKEMKQVTRAIFEGTLDGGSVIQGTVWTDKQLTEKFGLTEEGRALYRQARAAIDASLDEVAASEAYGLAQVLVTNRSIRKQIIDNPRNAESLLVGAIKKQMRLIERAMVKATDEGKESLQESLNFHQDTLTKLEAVFGRVAQLKEAGYAPLMRFGRYTVLAQRLDPETGDVARDEDGNPETEYYGQFETEAEARAQYIKLRDQFKDDDLVRVTQPGVKSEMANQLFAGISPETLELFAMEVGADKVAKEYYQNALAERSALKRRLERKNIAGYDEDLTRVLSSFITSNGRFAAQRYYLRDLNNAVRFIPNRKGDVKDEAIKLKKFLADPADPAAPISGVMFAWFLGGSVASAAINSTQSLTMTLPYLSQYGAGKASAAISKAMAKVVGRAEVSDPVLREALKRAGQEGIVDAQEIFHLYQVGAQSIAAGLTNKLGRLPGVGGAVKRGGEEARARFTAFLTLWGSMFSAVESVNRKVAFMAAWDIAKQRNEPDPYAFAVQAVNETQGIYNKVNRPNWARNPFGRVLLTFSQYKIMYIELLSRMIKHGGPEGKRAAAMMFGVLMLLGGSQGIPFMEDLDDIIDTIGQILGYNTNMRRDKRKLIKDVLGKSWSDFLLYGVSTLLPIDFSGRMGLGNMLPGTAALRPSDENNRGRQALEVLGPAGGLVSMIGDAYDAAVSGNTGKMAEAVAPIAVKNLLQGTEMFKTGEASDYRGRFASEVTKTESAGKMIGFNPQSRAQQFRTNSPIQQDIALAKNTESDIVALWARGIKKNDADMVKKAEAMLEKWNQRNPGTPIQITGKQITGAVRDLYRSPEERLLKTAPKELRGRVGEGLDAVE